jgi:hypothetical protein
LKTTWQQNVNLWDFGTMFFVTKCCNLKPVSTSICTNLVTTTFFSPWISIWDPIRSRISLLVPFQIIFYHGT